MAITIRQTDDADAAKQLHDLAFPGAKWVGDDHHFWMAADAGVVVGFCSAQILKDTRQIFLSRGAVTQAARGLGLHRRMIRRRIAFGRLHGCIEAISYVTLADHKYESLVNLQRCGFRLYTPDKQWVGYDVHYLHRAI